MEGYEQGRESRDQWIHVSKEKEAIELKTSNKENTNNLIIIGKLCSLKMLNHMAVKGMIHKSW